MSESEARRERELVADWNSYKKVAWEIRVAGIKKFALISLLTGIFIGGFGFLFFVGDACAEGNGFACFIKDIISAVVEY